MNTRGLIVTATGARKDPLDGQTNDPGSVSVVVVYTEPFSLIVKVKSPRVWDVICSTLVLYRSEPGLGRGVGVFKGDYTQRQGWLYWRSSTVALIPHIRISVPLHLSHSPALSIHTY